MDKVIKKSIYLSAVMLVATGSVVANSATTPKPVDLADEVKRVLVDPEAWSDRQACKASEPDRSPEDASVYDPRCEQRVAYVLDGMTKAIEKPSSRTLSLRGGVPSERPLGLSIGSFDGPFTYNSGYEKQPAKLQATFAYDLAAFQCSRGVNQFQVKAPVTKDDLVAQSKTLRYRAYENFAVAWWYANSPHFQKLTVQQRKEWAFESLIDGVLVYNCYLNDKLPGKTDRLDTFLHTFATGLALAHMNHDENRAVGG